MFLLGEACKTEPRSEMKVKNWRDALSRQE
jgi:hypothetical protein